MLFNSNRIKDLYNKQNKTEVNNETYIFVNISLQKPQEEEEEEEEECNSQKIKKKTTLYINILNIFIFFLQSSKIYNSCTNILL